jgi:hypothetical protein
VIAQLYAFARVLAGRVTLPRPYVCSDCPRVRRSLTAAQYREWVRTYVVLCRCGQRMAQVEHPAFVDYQPKVSN